MAKERKASGTSEADTAALISRDPAFLCVRSRVPGSPPHRLWQGRSTITSISKGRGMWQESGTEKLRELLLSALFLKVPVLMMRSLEGLAAP